MFFVMPFYSEGSFPFIVIRSPSEFSGFPVDVWVMFIKLRMILCFPNPVISKRVIIFFSLIVSSKSTKEVIFPFLFSVPSTFCAIMGLSRV